jgi:hypothetical protein
MPNRRRVNPQPLTAEQTRNFKTLIENAEDWPDFEKLMLEITRYSVELPKLYNILSRAQLDHLEYELQESRRCSLVEWLNDVEATAKKMCKLADELWSTNGYALNRRAALELAGWKGPHQIDFLNYAHAIEKMAHKTKEQSARPKNRPARPYVHRAKAAMEDIKVPDKLLQDLLVSIGLKASLMG